MRWVAVLVLSVCGLTCCSSLAFDGVIARSDSCSESCKLTYSLHTYPHEEELFACQRGCRLFSICQFVSDGEVLNGTLSKCISACQEAYSNDEQYACSLGCRNQFPFAQKRQEELFAMMPRIHLLYPLNLVRTVWSDMMSQAQELFSFSWTVYLQADDGKVVFQMWQQEPVITEKMGLKEEPYEMMSDPQYRDYSRGYVHDRLGAVVSRDQSDPENNYDFFSCLSKKLLQPSWILTITLILSVLVLNWICCATIATASQQYIPAQKLSLYRDLEFMKGQKLILYPQSSLVLDLSVKTEDEAGPLPSKIKLDLTKMVVGPSTPTTLSESEDRQSCNFRTFLLSSFKT